VTTTPTCNCPLESIVTTTVSAKSATCFCPKETIITTTATGRCHCPLESIVTTTASGICHCPLESIVTTTARSRCNCPLETIVPTTITRYGACNTTSHSRPTVGTGTGTATGTATPSPPCTIYTLPDHFFLRASPDTYLSVDLTSKTAHNIPKISNATLFHVRTTSDGSISGITQLAFNRTSPNSTTTVEYGAWIQTSGVSHGSPIEFVDVNEPPGQGSGYGIVTASFSKYFCEMVLITWMDHDLSYPLDCQGKLWLGGGSIGGGCRSVKLTVSTGLN
jgi:hypothetical protein